MAVWLATGGIVTAWLFSDGFGGEQMAAVGSAPPAMGMPAEDDFAVENGAAVEGMAEAELNDYASAENPYLSESYLEEYFDNGGDEIEPGAGTGDWGDGDWGDEASEDEGWGESASPPMAMAAPPAKPAEDSELANSELDDAWLDVPFDDDDGSMLGTSVPLANAEPASPSDRENAAPMTKPFQQFSAPRASTWSSRQGQSQSSQNGHRTFSKSFNGKASVAIPQKKMTAKLRPPTAARAKQSAPKIAPPTLASPAVITVQEEVTPSAIDQALSRMQLGSIAFNTPEEIPYGETETIELRLSPKESEAVLSSTVQGRGTVETARIKISNQMDAKLSGLGFDVEPITAELQAISHNEPTIWRWHIEPNRTDVQPLHLTLTAHLKIDGDKMTRTVKTFERDIAIRVPFTTKVMELASGHSEILISMLIVPLAASFWRRYRSKKSLDSASEAPAATPPEEPRQAA